jgi:epimerase EvaD
VNDVTTGNRSISTPTAKVRALAVEGSYEFTPRVYHDTRGLFVSPLQEDAFVAAVGRRFPVAQTNHSRSARGVLRGVHFTTTPPGQAKYVHCARGRAMDVVVDIRVGSPTFGASEAVCLDAEDFRAVYVPDGVGHAFLALEDDTVMSYLASTPYRPDLEQAIAPRDPELALPWPEGMDFVLSERDTRAVTLAQARVQGLLPRYEDCLTVAEAYR